MWPFYGSISSGKYFEFQIIGNVWESGGDVS